MPGIWDSITEFFGRGKRNNEVIGLPQNMQWVNNVAPIYPDSKTGTFVKDAFGGNASVFTIISKSAKKFGHITRGLYEVKDQKAAKLYQSLTRKGLSTEGAFQKAIKSYHKAYGEVQVSNDLSALIMRPNKWQGQDAFFMLAMIFYKSTGEAFIWLNRGDGDKNIDDAVWAKKPVLEMFILPSQAVELIPDKDDIWSINGYWFNVNGKREFIRPVDMIHWKMPNPNFDTGTNRTHLRGFAPLKAGLKIWTMDDDSTDAMVAMYQNGGAKGVAFDKGMKQMSPLQESRLKEITDEKVNNKKRKAAVAFIQGDWGYLNLGLSSVDMQLIEGNEKAFIALCNLLDVPSELFVPDQKFANKSISIKDWLNNSVIPDACSLRDEMNRVLLPAFGLTSNKYIIDNDISDIPELQSDLEKMTTYLNTAWWLTPNQKLEYMNEETNPAEGMDEIWMPANMVRMQDSLDAVTMGLTQQGLNDYGNNGTDSTGSGQEVSNVSKAYSGAGD